MSDLEMTRLCAEAMGGLPLIEHEGKLRFGSKSCMGPYCDPIHDDAQAMKMIARFKLELTWNDAATEPRWDVFPCPSATMLVNRISGLVSSGRSIGGHNDTLNRAIVECVAKMQAERKA